MLGGPAARAAPLTAPRLIVALYRGRDYRWCEIRSRHCPCESSGAAIRRFLSPLTSAHLRRAPCSDVKSQVTEIRRIIVLRPSGVVCGRLPARVVAAQSGRLAAVRLDGRLLWRGVVPVSTHWVFGVFLGLRDMAYSAFRVITFLRRYLGFSPSCPSACLASLFIMHICPATVFDCFRFMELAEVGRCRAPVSPPQTHRGGLLSSIGMAVAVCWGCPRWSNARAAGSAVMMTN